MRSGRIPHVQSAQLHRFALSSNANIPRSSFDRTHGCKTTFDAGYLVPIFLDEALPGDTFNLKMTAFARFATPIFPIMDNLTMETFFFSVPYRLVWDNWQKFNGEQKNPGDSTSFVIPQVVAPAVTGFTEGSLFDYFGLPTQVPGISVSTLFNRAYNLIWNEWFRDENLQDSVVVDVDNGPDDPADYVLLRRGKRYDYFTSCLPFPQKGDAVELPLGSSAPVVTTGVVPNFSASGIGTGTAAVDVAAEFPLAGGFNAFRLDGFTGSGTGQAMTFANPTGLEADLSTATAATINDIRLAFQTQKLLERDARGGTRYTEVIRAHFGVTSPDMRLQRPEFLGGGHSPVIINPIAQTSSTDGTSPQGNLAAFGICSAHGHGFVKSFTEHEIVIGLVCVRADLNYQQGINRMFSRSTRYDFYWPAFSHIGEQAVLNQEIFADGTAADQDVFGYQERYAEYRYKPSIVTGAFRSNAAATLDAWHLAQDFAALPSLNASFIVENPPVDRVIAVPTEPHFLFDSFFKYHCARPMPVRSIPGLIDHF